MPDLNPEARVVLAEAVFNIARNASDAKALVAGVEQPALVTDFLGGRSTIAPFLQRLRLNRLLFSFGDARRLADIVPFTGDARHEGLVFFERGLTAIAKIWAEAWKGRALDPGTIVQEAAPLLRLFSRRGLDVRHWTYWDSLQGLRGEFYELLVDSVAEHGPEAVDALAEAFDAEWALSDSARYWPSHLRRSIVRRFFENGKTVEWAGQRLAALEAFMLEGEDVGGRVSECQKQAEAWRAIGKPANARRLIERALQVSFGVGYRKDYQLDDWIAWLDRANKVDHDGAKQRILWFVRALPTLEDVIEGRAVSSAGTELLNACFRWSPRRAMSLFHFFIRHRIVRYEDALGSIVTDALAAGMLPSEIAVHAVAEFLVPIARSGSQELAEALMRKTQAEGRDVIETGRMLLSQASVLGLPTTRKQWRRGVGLALQSMGEDLGELGLTADDLRPDRNDGEIGGLRLKDGSRLTREEVSARVNSAADLEALLINESEDSYFDWRPILVRVGDLLDRRAVDRIAAGLGERQRSAFGLATLSQIATRVGDAGRAWQLALRALDASREYGWSRWMDGGSRLAALEALVRADKDRGRVLGFQTLARDGGGGAANLDEILPLLTDDLPVLPIWREMEKHVEALFEGAEFISEGLPDFDTEPGDDTPSRAIADLIASHVSHPSLLVAQSAQRAAAKLLLRGTAAMQDAIRDGLRGPEDRQEQLLSLLESVGKRDAAAVEMFRDAVIALYGSPNYLVRSSALYIGKALQWGASSAPAGPPLTLPPIYEFELPPTRPDIVGRGEVSATGFLPDTENPEVLVGLWAQQYDEVAKLASFPKRPLYYRAAQIMGELAPRDTWSSEGERRLRGMLNAAGLEFSFRRPRSVIARRALFHVIAELLDAGRIAVDEIAELLPLLTFDDPDLLLWAPQPRPAEIASIARGDRYRDRDEDWIERTEEARRAMKKTLGTGSRILGEYTTLKILDWAQPRERRLSGVSIARTTGSDKIFDETDAVPLEVYPKLRTQDGLVIRNNAFMYDTAGAMWLAINPSVAAQLKWRPHNERPLTWTDVAGTITAQTIWWIDGALQHAPPSLNDQVGEGWIVVASTAGYEALRSELGPLTRRSRVERSFLKDGSPEKRVLDWSESAG